MVEGWPVVVPKGQFSVNELILFFEIGSFLPFYDERYEPYRSSQMSAKLCGERGWVVQTVKLAGHISQGMLFRIDDQFPEVDRIKEKISDEGDYYDMPWDAQENMNLSPVDLALMEKDLTGEFRVETWATFCRWMNETELLSFRTEIELILSQTTSMEALILGDRPASSPIPNSSEPRTCPTSGRDTVTRSLRSPS